jgi:predicted NBD/HSP70 family sugar kinase
LTAIPAANWSTLLAEQIVHACRQQGEGPVDAIGVAVPGIVRHGVVEDSPNLPQIKGMRLAEELTKVLAAAESHAPVHVANDADAIAAGVAATRGRLNKLTRVWTIGNGIGYGRWPYVEGVWEGGHITVTLDPKERFCGCGGVGHLEGIMGSRAMRMRFLDLEPEEVFANAKAGDHALPGVCRPVASRAGRGDGFFHPPGRPRTLLLHRAQRAAFWSCHCCAAIWKPWSDEPAAELLAGDPAPGRRNRAARRRRRCQ